jgi:pimeloyl-ACP methyl ester carboxylesterase
MLALEYLFTKPSGVTSLVLKSSPANIPLWVSEARRLREDLSEPTKLAMRRFEDNYTPRAPKTSTKVKPGPDAKKLESTAKMMQRFYGLMTKPWVQRLAARASAIPFLRRPAYEIVSLEFVRKHVCRVEPFPASAFRMLAGMGRPVYETMWGPSEFYGVGLLKDWNVVARLPEIDVPTLITSGRHDEATPKQMEEIRDGIPGAEWVVFEDSSHCALFEEPERYRAVLTDFLDKVEARSTA